MVINRWFSLVGVAFVAALPLLVLNCRISLFAGFVVVLSTDGSHPLVQRRRPSLRR